MRTLPHAILYTRKGCHLCDVAQALLSEHGIEPEVVHIDAHPELVERYTNCVPVVLLNGRERFRGVVNPVLLKRLLK